MTIVGASAVALLAGYLFFKKDKRKKTKKKPGNDLVVAKAIDREEDSGVSEFTEPCNDCTGDEKKMPAQAPLAGNNTSHINEYAPNCDVVEMLGAKPCGDSNLKHSETPDDVSIDSGNGESDLHHSSNSVEDESQKSLLASSDALAVFDQSIPESMSSVSISSSTSQYNELDVIVYEFHFPRKFCGKLIGRNGVHVDYIRNKTQVQIAVRDDLVSNDLQVVSVTGCICNVDQALEIISARFPCRTYPNVSFKPITKPIIYKRNNATTNKVFVSQSQFVQLQPTANQIDVHVSAIVNSAHIFIQLPFNETFEYLQRLDENMLYLYSNLTDDIPSLQTPLQYGTICAAPTSYGWHRAMITNYFSKEEWSADRSPALYYNQLDEACDIATLKFLDYGGYLNIPASQLKQLR
jgi:hypothetical protein